MRGYRQRRGLELSDWHNRIQYVTDSKHHCDVIFNSKNVIYLQGTIPESKILAVHHKRTPSLDNYFSYELDP